MTGRERSFEPRRHDDTAIIGELRTVGRLTARALCDRPAVHAVRGLYYDQVYARLKYLERKGAVRRVPGGHNSRWLWEAVRDGGE